ncbi:hypothetical protein T8K17_02235 [Thalassobaculum sp. OXR-137]|uniref:hypothetical protein n=1 Tax=Thalassobaculum sp. OXR-137 TaxID=3100173 RepID=UPI002AC9949B|nr:hypothetical protein [Thalassobaculum sp. OXR-137]WPZ34971.1 hypothetical protein T8K17_02235 [Thalassobaculum sp. OXR-137]
MDETRRTLLLALAALATGGLAACGKRGDPNPPKDRPSPHPRSYPAPYQTKVLTE